MTIRMPQESWRREFPIEATAEADCSRRRFVQNVSLASGAAVIGQGILLAENSIGPATPEYQPLEPVLLPVRWDEIPVGGTVLFHFPSRREPAILVRLDEQRYVAYRQKCTHLACPVIPDVARLQLDCPCHHGAFDLTTGSPTAGPPRDPLQRIRIEIAEDQSLRATGLFR